MLEEKTARDEEYAFQQQIDAEYKKTDEIHVALNTLHTQLNYLYEQKYQIDDRDQAAHEAQQAKIDYVDQEIAKY